MAKEQHVNLKVSEEDLSILVDALAIAHWVVCDGETAPDPNYRDLMHRLQQRIYAQLHSEGRSDLIRHDQEGDCFDPESLEDDDSRPFKAIRDHEDETFWEELIMRFAAVLSVREVGEARWEALDRIGRFEVSFAHEERIRATLGKHGLRGLFLISGEPAG